MAQSVETILALTAVEARAAHAQQPRHHLHRGFGPLLQHQPVARGYRLMLAKKAAAFFRKAFSISSSRMRLCASLSSRPAASGAGSPPSSRRRSATHFPTVRSFVQPELFAASLDGAALGHGGDDVVRRLPLELRGVLVLVRDHEDHRPFVGIGAVYRVLRTLSPVSEKTIQVSTCTPSRARRRPPSLSSTPPPPACAFAV